MLGLMGMMGQGETSGTTDGKICYYLAFRNSSGDTP